MNFSKFLIYLALIGLVVVGIEVGMRAPRRGPHPDWIFCVANLKQIDGAKEQWALFERIKENREPTEQDLYGESEDDLIYIKSRLQCPGGGKYRFGLINQPPTCSIGGKHTLRAEKN